MWPYPWTDVGTPSHLGHMDRVAATMPSQAHAGAAQEAPDIGQWEGQDVPLVRPSSCNVEGGIPSSRTYLPTYLHFTVLLWARVRMGHVCPRFARNPMMPLCFICFSLCVAIHLMDRIDVIVSCMIMREPMGFLKPLYLDCVGMASYVHNGTHSWSVHGP